MFLKSKTCIYIQELADVRKRSTFRMNDDNGQSTCCYDRKLEAAIKELREQQYADLEAVKDELEEHYEAKVGTYLNLKCD